MTENLTIRVSTGVGAGQTTLAAFDAALAAAGVCDFNLVQLSSIIPAGSEVQEVKSKEQLQGRHGDVLYCVYARAHASLPGHEAWAGVAWSRHDDGSGAGLFVEHSGPSREQVSTDLTHSLDDLANTRGEPYHPEGRQIAGISCVTLPVCAVVVATFRCAGWKEIGRGR
ncbi:pyruvoyl-dependent arginine decarboxylase [Myceligenerans indicum]|uniref:Pyruvoyl-dependent arginine decarboxylase AaxB n=1 Tax=Myceligenerans indicum TaxID=2593663 RepID=A0ABS1LNQ0_9MICO|nr:pyruvoyl-dependent arginine decarboxylase [Myceligenerans indicum]MBL0887719.1 pyruvoyl-dependent arginine decarboxylase [Myceligenerans indicum]